MVNTTFFQSCPTCGRGVLIPVAYLGREVACQHCDAHFQTRMSSDEQDWRQSVANAAVPGASVVDRADALLGTNPRGQSLH